VSRQYINRTTSAPIALPTVGTKPRLGRRLGDPAIPAALHCHAETLPVAGGAAVREGCGVE
jgi:hypothetical protein